MKGPSWCTIRAQRVPGSNAVQPPHILTLCINIAPGKICFPPAGPMTDSTLSGTSGSGQGKRVHSARNAASKTDSSSGAEVSTLDKAIETASAAGSWLLQTGEAQGKRLLQIGRSWMAGDERQEDATRSEKPGSRKIGTGHQEPGANDEDVRTREELAAKALAERAANSSTGSTGEESALAESDSKGSHSGAWRRGRLDENDGVR